MSFGYQVLGFGAHVQGGVSPLLTDLVAYWSMDEASGTRVDSHTNGYDLTDNNTVDSAAGLQGNAASFTSANSEYLSHADNADFSAAGTDFSFFFWVKTSGNFGGPSKDDSASNRQYRLFNAGAPCYWLIMNNGSTVAQAGPSATVVNGAWHSIYCVYTPGDFTAGISADNQTLVTATGGGGTQMGDVAAPFNIMRFNSSTYGTGLIDEVGFWHRTLTAAERTWLHNSGSGRSWADIQAYSP